MALSKALFVLTLTAMGAASQVNMPGVLSSHMIVQRDRPIHVWGWAAPGERVSVEMHGANRTATASSTGTWSVFLPPEPAGGPYQLTVAGTNKIVLDDVLIGDVWLASGQSNMEMPLKGFDGAPLKDSAAEIAKANHPQIRLLHVPRKASPYPVRNIDAAWTACTPETAANISAAGYFFSRELNERLQVPIGLIDATWGGTVIESWMSLGYLGSDPSLLPVFNTRAQLMDVVDDQQISEKRQDAAAKQAGQAPPKRGWRPDISSWDPSWLFNGMIAPETGHAIKGVIWYQGESNSRLAFAPMYARLMPALIADWRAQWHLGDIPFLYVQISNFKSNATENWPVIREAQRRSLAVANTAMAVTIDVGNPDNVHPADKQTVGARLALAARAVAYGENVEYAGPLFRQATPEDSALRVWFDHTAKGLVAKGGDLQGFEIAGPDGKFVPAAARIDGKTIVVSSDAVKDPRQVRYGWANSPTVNLYNSEDLPASPFTSEDRIPNP